MRVVISQPMYFPWPGLFEQIRLAEVYVHLDDVRPPRGRSFLNRVQIKTPQGSHWLTAPLAHAGDGMIRDLQFDATQDWRRKQLETLRRNYARAPFADEMLALAAECLACETASLAEFNIHAIERVCAYFGLERRFLRSAHLSVTSEGSDRILHLVQALGGSVYITGHGALNYLDHPKFEQSGIAVEYMDYLRTPYPQLHRAFDPHVSILDLIANVGRQGIEFLHSPSRSWKQFLHESDRDVQTGSPGEYRPARAG
ncbi:MAG TPA: WbqC family protein [Planctomycetaceae bacterium]|nr:WbqC family protein [Planctomycetaceae bacterium]